VKTPKQKKGEQPALELLTGNNFISPVATDSRFFNDENIISSNRTNRYLKSLSINTTQSKKNKCNNSNSTSYSNASTNNVNNN
jgi:hypothetical protein